MIARGSFACAAAALFLAACGGGTPGGFTLPSASDGATNGTMPLRQPKSRLEIRLKIPKRNRHVHYVSASTKSIVVFEGTTKLGGFNTTPSAGGCTSQAGSTLCTFRFELASGANKTLVVNAYDRTKGAGKLLSSGSVTKTIVTGLNVIPLTLDGVVASVAIAIQNPSSPAGTAAKLALTVMASDPDGNIIIGPGKYSAPITLTDSDASGKTHLSTTTATGPNDRITLQYTGGVLTSATIGASATGVTAITPARFTPTPAVAGNFILPTSIGARTGLSLEANAITSSGSNLWVSGDDNNHHGALFTMTTSGAFTTFIPGAGVSIDLPNDYLNGLAPGPDGSAWYVGDVNVGNITPLGAATDQSLNSVGLPGCSNPNGRRIVPANDLGAWFTVDCSTVSQLAHLATNGFLTANALPSTFVPNGLVVGTDGNVYVAGVDNGTTAAILRATVSGSTVTGTSIVDVPAAGTNAVGIAQSADGDLWETVSPLTSCAPASSLVRLHLAAGFAQSSTSVFPTLAGCSYPNFPSALADGSLWVPEFEYDVVEQVIPGANQAAPALFDLALPSPPTVFAEMHDSTVGPDGYLYFTNDDVGQPTFSSNVVKVAY